MAKKTAQSAKKSPAKKTAQKKPAKPVKAAAPAKKAAAPAKKAPAVKKVVEKAPQGFAAKAASLMKSAAEKVEKAAKTAVDKVEKAVKAAPAVEEKTQKLLSAKPALKVVKTEPAEDVSAPVEVVEKPVKAAAPKAPRVEKPVKTKVVPLRASKAASAGDDEGRWQDLYEKYKSEKAQAYDMKGAFEAGKPLQHKILGWGWILSNENDRLEVLFKDGRRMLISNYDPSR